MFAFPLRSICRLLLVASVSLLALPLIGAALDVPPQLPDPLPFPLTRVSQTQKDIAEIRAWIIRQRKAGQLSATQEQRFGRVLVALRARENENLRTAREKDLITNLLKTLQQKVLHNRNLRRPREELAAFHAMLGEYDKMLTYLRNVGPASPTDLNHFIQLLEAYSQLGDFKNAARQLAEVERLLSPRVPLRLSTPEFASSVQAYRLYKPMSRKGLKPGKLALLYIEIDGAAFQKQPATGQASYQLLFKLDIKDAFQKSIDTKTFAPYKLTFQGQVRDLHASLPLRIPAGLPDGEYHVLITCRDQFADKNSLPATCGTDFTIGVAPPAEPPRPPAIPPKPVTDTIAPPRTTRTDTQSDLWEPPTAIRKTQKYTRTTAGLDPANVDLRRSSHALPHAKNKFE